MAIAAPAAVFLSMRGGTVEAQTIDYGALHDKERRGSGDLRKGSQAHHEKRRGTGGKAAALPPTSKKRDPFL